MTVFAEVVVDAPPVRGAFHYHLPPDLEGRVGPGHLVIVPFGKRRVQGVVTRLLDEAEVPETRPIEGLVDPGPVLQPEQLALAAWMADQYLAPLIDCLTLMLPPGLSQQADQRVSLLDILALPQTTAEKRVLALLAARGPLRGRQLDYHLPRIDWRRAVDTLARRGALVRESILDAPTVRPRRIRSVMLTAAAPPEASAQSLGGTPEVSPPPEGGARATRPRTRKPARQLGVRRDRGFGRRPALPRGA